MIIKELNLDIGFAVSVSVTDLCCRVYIPYSEDTSSSSSKFGEALVNTLVFLAIVVVMTIVLVVLYKYRCYKVQNYVY